MGSILKINDTVAFFAASNGLSPFSKDNISSLKLILESFGLKVIYGNNLFAPDKNIIFNETSQNKGKNLNKLFADKDIRAIFDLSGGDLSNSIIDYLDFDLIKRNPKPFFGYSDLSTILNSIYTKAGFPTFYYNLKNLITGDYKEEQISLFKSSIMGNSNDLFKFKYDFLSGKALRGFVVGGNIRCTLKLAGTPYSPNFSNKILFLEAYSGNAAKIYTYLNQYKQIGAFDDLKGIILGSFTEMELNNITPSVSEMLIEILGDEHKIPIAKTLELGHGSDSKCIVIGGSCTLN
ncbi:LD-carboxypeptidase [uncultured Clostridium sp.]|jgi:muramoyltetrapeptide carboxypeptidase LdcA involved in peptidoglycan recycling|uniref:S66 peptidase family protein n=1 Tax=uncultured Clostridium sp. TaxID=59620 RepID=UPI002608FD60|nr:LD-carboxypeptidase [uncultured Clostridium sp.]